MDSTPLTTAPANDAAKNGHATATTKLFPFHVTDLERSGISVATALHNGLYSEGNQNRLAGLLNRKSWSRKLGCGLVFPYFDDAGTTVLCRVKPDRPPNYKGKPAKYLSPGGAGVRAYFPLGTHQCIANGEVRILVTEGEKKAISATQAGFCCIALSGVDCWHPKRSTTLLPDLANIKWGGRTAYIAFDSDVAMNAKVLENEQLLAAALKQRGAVVKVLRFQPAADGSKVGLDDFLVANGAAALNKMMAEASEPEEPSPESLKSSVDKVDPADLAAMYCDTLKSDGICKLVYWRDNFWYWQKGAFREVPDNDIRARVTAFLAEDFSQVRMQSLSNVLLHLRSQCLLPAHIDAPTWRDPGPPPDTYWKAAECVATKSDIVHLPSLAATGAAHSLPCTPAFFTTCSVNYEFDPNAARPENWLSFLNSIWGDDQQSIETLQQFMGYCLTSDTSQHKLLMIVGPKRSGKGTIVRVLRALVGEQNTAAPTLSSLCGRFGLWPLLGKSLAVINDARLGGRSDQAEIVERILSITGEDAQTVDRKNLPPITVTLPARIVIVSNELPRLSDASGAFTSRCIMLRTTESFFGREDHNLTDRLLGELPGVFMWAVCGWESLRQRGRFTQPESGKEILSEFNDLTSPVAAFIREQCETTPTAWVDAELLYAAWRKWCEASGRMRPTDKATFGRDLRACEPSVRRTRPRDGQHRTYRYEGIGLKEWS